MAEKEIVEILMPDQPQNQHVAGWLDDVFPARTAMPLPIDHLIERLEEEHQTSITNGWDSLKTHQLRKVLEWAKKEKAAHEKLNAERWDGVEPIPEDAPEFPIQHALSNLKKVLAETRGRHGRDFIRRLPQGKLLDALDAGRETGYPSDSVGAA